MAVTLDTEIRLRNDSYTAFSTSGAPNPVLAKGEPFYMPRFQTTSGVTYDVLVIGDGSHTLGYFLDEGKYFIAQKGAGYVLERATAYTTGGVTIPEDRGIKTTEASPDIWVDVEGLISTNGNLKLVNPEPGYEGFGRLKVDLTKYIGDVEIEGTLKYTSVEENPASISNTYTLRQDATTAMTSNFSGIVINSIDSALRKAWMGVDKDGRMVYNYGTSESTADKYLVATVREAANDYALIGINTNGLIQEASLQELIIETKPNSTASASEITSQTINLLSNLEQKISLIIPKKLSDLSDYNESATGPSYVSALDREVWNNVIIDVRTNNTITSPRLVDYKYEETERYAKRLELPASPIDTGEALHIDDDDKLDLKPITVERPDPETQPNGKTITYITDIEVDEYGRVTKITKERIRVQ